MRSFKFFYGIFLTALLVLGSMNAGWAQGDYCTFTSILINGSCITENGSTTGLSADSEFESSCFGSETYEGWYWIIGGVNGTSYTIEVDGAGSTDVVVSIVGMDDAICSTPTEIGCVDAVSSSAESISFTWNEAAYDYYYVQIYGYSGGTADFTICAYGGAAPSCSDGILNGTETGVDCGGSCSPCSDGQESPSDCDGAVVLCTDGSVAYNPTGPGLDDFSDVDNDDGCLGGENLSAWYYFEFNSSTPASSVISFDILPDDGAGEDYDFAIYGPSADCGDLGSPIRCSFAAVGYSGTDGPPSGVGSTGLASFSSDNSEDSFGDSYVASMTVNPGEGYWLLVDNYAVSNEGFTLNWSGSAAPFLDCTATPGCDAAPNMIWD